MSPDTSPPMVEAVGLTKTFALPATALFGKPRSVTAAVDVSFRIPRGRTFGLVGESGSGKSTVAKMLLKLEAPTAGRLLVEGKDIFAQTPAEELAYRRKVQAVFQDPYGSLSPRMRADRIVTEPLRAHGVGRREAEDRVPDLLRLVGLPPESARKYPHEFSGGQRQRLAIARALLKDPPVLILDEATSALDAATEARVQRALRALMKGRTTFIIAHRLSTVREADEILVFEGGKIVERGSYEELVAAGGRFAELVRTQLTGGAPVPAHAAE